MTGRDVTEQSRKHKKEFDTLFCKMCEDFSERAEKEDFTIGHAFEMAGLTAQKQTSLDEMLKWMQVEWLCGDSARKLSFKRFNSDLTKDHFSHAEH